MAIRIRLHTDLAAAGCHQVWCSRAPDPKACRRQELQMICPHPAYIASTPVRTRCSERVEQPLQGNATQSRTHTKSGGCRSVVFVLRAWWTAGVNEWRS